MHTKFKKRILLIIITAVVITNIFSYVLLYKKINNALVKRALYENEMAFQTFFNFSQSFDIKNNKAIEKACNTIELPNNGFIQVINKNSKTATFPNKIDLSYFNDIKIKAGGKFITVDYTLKKKNLSGFFMNAQGNIDVISTKEFSDSLLFIAHQDYRLIKKESYLGSLQVFLPILLSCALLMVIVFLLISKEARSYKNRTDSLIREKDLFTNMLAHDLKNPYSSIVLFLDYIEKKGLKPDILSMSQLIRHEISSALQFIDNVLSIGKLESKKRYPLEKTEILLPVLSAIKSNEIMAKKKNITIHTKLISIQKQSNFFILERVMVNLLNNAINYSPKDSNIYISISKEKKPTIEIRDEGPGIPKRIRSSLFKKQFNHSSSTNESKGLGLYLCKVLLDKIDAKISFDTKLNKGTVFKVEL